MAFTVQKFFKFNLAIMRLLGFYPPQKFKKIYKLYAVMVYVCLTIPVPILSAIHLIVDENVDLAEICDSSFIMFQAGCFIFKLTPFIFNVDEVRKAIYMLEWPAFANYTKNEETMMEESVKVCRQNTQLFLGFCASTCTAWAVTPFFGSVHKFPIEVWLPMDVTSNSILYAFVYIFVCLGVGNGAIANGVIDPLVSGMACFATYQIKVLKYNLQHLDNDVLFVKHDGRERENFSKEKIIYQRIKDCILHHNAIIEFTQYYEKIFSSVAFTQFVASMIVICVSCLQLSMVKPFTFTFFAMISFLCTMLLEVFLYCYLGANLYEESNSLTSAIYMSKWYEYDLKSQKSLIILMERSEKPLIVTAGKILDLSLVTFTTILRRAYSLLAVLNNYQ